MCNWLEIAAAVAGGYLIGSLPAGYLLAKIKTGKDVREFGSGATGATNTARVIGKKLGILIALFDISKGIAAFILGTILLNVHAGAYIAAITAVVGHCYPVWIGFRGGKGVSTAFGATVITAPIPAILALGMFVISAVITRRISAASIIAIWAFSGFVFMLEAEIPVKIISILLALFIAFTHRQNMIRLYSGMETPFLGE